MSHDGCVKISVEARHFLPRAWWP